MTTRALTTLLVAALLGAGCTHTMEVRSEPPGAEVLLDGEPVGVTPLVLERPTSHANVRTLVVRQGDEEARLALLEEGWAIEPILGSILGAVATGALGLGVGFAGYITSLLFAISSGPNVGLLTAGVFGGLLILYAGMAVAAAATHLPFIGAGELARVGPDEVYVDFSRDKVSTSPPGQVKPMIGVSEGYRPLRWHHDDGR